MKYCTKCVQSDTRPNIYFNDEGVCGACLWEEDGKNKIDWDLRKKELHDVAEWARKTTRTAYDCIVGVSGGKDSTYQALFARDKLGLRTLLVNAAPDCITEVGKYNIENLTQLGFDVITIRPNPVFFRKMAKTAFYKFLHNGRIAELYLWASAYIIADKFDIPLIIQGENAGLTLGVRNEKGIDDDALKVQQLNTLKAGLQPFLDEGANEKDLYLYWFDPDKLRKKDVKAIWLNYYAKEWTPYHNAFFSIKHGLKVRPAKTFDDFLAMGTHANYFQMDGDGVHVNQMLKHIKFGFGQCTDHACYDIREGRMTREEGIALLQTFDGKCGEKYINNYCNYIGISVEDFWDHANKFRGPMWKKESDKWILLNPIWEQEPPSKNIDVNKVTQRLLLKDNY